MLPWLGWNTPATIFISVDLPAPFSPISACTVPGRTRNCTPSSATTPGNSLRTSFSSSRYGVAGSSGPAASGSRVTTDTACLLITMTGCRRRAREGPPSLAAGAGLARPYLAMKLL